MESYSIIKYCNGHVSGWGIETTFNFGYKSQDSNLSYLFFYEKHLLDQLYSGNCKIHRYNKQQTDKKRLTGQLRSMCLFAPKV